MARCRFDLKTNILGLDISNYKFINLGDKYAKLDDHALENGKHTFKLTSRHKKNDFVMCIESVWELTEGKKTFRVIHCIVSIDLFGVIQPIYVIPESHRSMLIEIFNLL